MRPVVPGLSAVALLVGCIVAHASDQNQAAGALGRPLQLEPGPIVVTYATRPAVFSFDRAEGRLETSAEGAANAARAVLNTPNLGHPQLEAAAGVLGFVAAPFAAGYGALRAPHQKLSADKLSEAEQNLTAALSAMAGQQNLRDPLLKSAGQKGRRRLIPLEPAAPVYEACETVGGVLETRIEELRLERTGKGDHSYVLHIRARARMAQAADGAVLLERPYEYKSGKAMFVDWTRWSGLESVAQTGYRQLADQIAEEFLPMDAEQPLLRGAGYKRSPMRESARPEFAVKRDEAARAGLQLVSYGLSGDGAIEIFPAHPLPGLIVQRPLTKAEAVSEAQEETEWVMDGLENDRNFVVQTVSCIAAVPVGLWKQTVGLVRGVSGNGLAKAEARLKAAADEAQPPERLAGEVARVLTPKTSIAVVLGAKPGRQPGLPAGQDSQELVPVAFKTLGDNSVVRGPETELHIKLVAAKLAGQEGINSRLALCLEARATLARKQDGQELYSCPVKYRSAERPFKVWAAHNARLFRQELAQGCQEMGQAIADQFLANGMVPAGRGHGEVARN